jgi:hypothetical protein
MNKTNRITKGTYSDFRIVKTRNVAQIIVEIPLEQAEEFVTMFGMPTPNTDKWVAVARLNDEVIERNDESTIAIQKAGMLCKEERFGIFLKKKKKMNEVNPFKSETIANALRALLGIKSRTELHERENRIVWNRLLNEYEKWLLTDSK